MNNNNYHSIFASTTEQSPAGGNHKKNRSRNKIKKEPHAASTTAPKANVDPNAFDRIDPRPASRKLNDSGVYFISEVIEPNMARNVVTWIIEENAKVGRDYDKLTLIINSPGGHVTAGFAIIDAMESSKIPVHTVALGQIASMGVSIFMAGVKGNRVIAPNTLIMSHQFSGGAMGKQHELVASTVGHGIVGDLLLDHYVKHTGLKRKTVKKKLLSASDRWLTPQQAVEYGIGDIVKKFGA